MKTFNENQNWKENEEITDNIKIYGNLDCMDLHCNNLNCWNLNCWNLNCKDLHCNNLNCKNLSFYAIAFAYSSIKCESMKARRENARCFVLGGNIEINGVDYGKEVRFDKLGNPIKEKGK